MPDEPTPAPPDNNFSFGYAAPPVRFEYAAPKSRLEYAAPPDPEESDNDES